MNGPAEANGDEKSGAIGSVTALMSVSKRKTENVLAETVIAWLAAGALVNVTSPLASEYWPGVVWMTPAFLTTRFATEYHGCE